MRAAQPLSPNLQSKYPSRLAFSPSPNIPPLLVLCPPFLDHNLPVLVMQALRLARPRVSLRTISAVRSIAATANASHATPAAGTSGSSAVIPLSNVEAQWENLSAEEQLAVHQQLEEIQKKDWRTLSIDEKKAGALVA